eukprot:8310448-Alexandrium_andersonii.AAC.1
MSLLQWALGAPTPAPTPAPSPVEQPDPAEAPGTLRRQRRLLRRARTPCSGRSRLLRRMYRSSR